jgi:hypothetical protein
MGVDFICDEKGLSCTYSKWNSIRKKILKVSLEYLKHKFEEDIKLHGTKLADDVNYIGEYSQYNYNKQSILNIIKNMDKDYSKDLGIDRTIDLFVSLTNKIKHTDALIYFEMGGLVSICNKSDCEGFYSPGNSLDICHLLNLLKPLLLAKNESEHNDELHIDYTTFVRMVELFEYSYKNLKNVIIL